MIAIVVIPANAGISGRERAAANLPEAPAFAGVTNR